MRTILFVFVFLGWALGAYAQESVSLKRGETVWAVLNTLNCLNQLDAVLEDSGIKPKLVTRLPVGQKIVVTRCFGFNYAGVVRESEALKTVNVSLAADLEKANARARELETRVSELEKVVAANQPFSGEWWFASVIPLAMSVLVLGVTIGFFGSWSRIKIGPRVKDDDLIYPRQKVEALNGKEFVFFRVHDRVSHRVAMKCPCCGVLVELDNTGQHLRREHRDEGRFTSNIDEIVGSSA